MRQGHVVLMLIYEPASADAEPVPLARISHMQLAAMVAESAVSAAEARARKLSDVDEILGAIETTEVRRLRELLRLLVPGFEKKYLPELNPAVM